MERNPFSSDLGRRAIHGNPRNPMVRLGEWLFGGTVAVCGISLVLDQYSAIWPGPDLRLGVHPSLAMRLIPLAGMLAATACFVLAARWRTFRRPMGRLIPVPVLCLVALTAWVLIGSTYSRVVDNNPYTFFSLGTAILCGPLAYWCFELTPDPVRLLRVWLVALAVGAALVLVSSLARFFFTQDGGFTEHFPVVFAFAALVWFQWPVRRVRIAAAVLVAVVCVLSLKKSGVMCTGAVALPLVVDYCVRRFGANARTGMILLGMILSVVLATTVLLLLLSDSLRTGEHAFRQYSYEIAWKQFERSPFIGQAYTGEGAIWNPYLTEAHYAVHNDVLDVLREGGVVGFTLFATGLYSAWWVLWRRRRHWRQAPPGLLAGATAITGTTVVFLFNPTLLTPDVAGIVWAMAGCTLWHQAAFRDAIRNQETTAWLHR